MARVYVSVGSNIDRERNVREAIAELRERYGELALSSVYETQAVGFDGDNFFNLVVAYNTDETPCEAAESLHDIESNCGRERTGPRFSARTMDLDLLLYDDLIFKEGKLVLPRGEIEHHAFVLGPLAELAPELVHPIRGKNYATLWDEMCAAEDCTEKAIWVVPFDL